MRENRYLFALSVPLIIYTVISALLGLLNNTSADPAENPVIRWTLMMVMFFFVYMHHLDSTQLRIAVDISSYIFMAKLF